MSESIRMTSTDRVRCKCPDRDVERIRAVAVEQHDGAWEVWANTHGPGTDCDYREAGGMLPPSSTCTQTSHESARVKTRAEAVAWLEAATSRQ